MSKQLQGLCHEGAASREELALADRPAAGQRSTHCACRTPWEVLQATSPVQVYLQCLQESTQSSPEESRL